MTKLKWAYVARGHYSAPDGDWTVHVLENGTVYKTHPSRATADVTGSKADRYIESIPLKFHVHGKKRAEPEREPEEKKETPRKEKKAPPPDKPKKTKRATKKQIGAAAKKLAKGAGAIIGTTRAFVTEVGEAEERAYARRKAPPPKKKAKPKPKPTKKAKPLAGARPTIVRKKKPEPTARREAPPQVTEHPLEYLISGARALPPTGRRPATSKRREQTLEEYMGF
jgi:hypothetical protein